MKNLFYILILVFSSTLCHSIKEQEQLEGINFILCLFNNDNVLKDIETLKYLLTKRDKNQLLKYLLILIPRNYLEGRKCFNENIKEKHFDLNKFLLETWKDLPETLKVTLTNLFVDGFNASILYLCEYFVSEKFQNICKLIDK